jgi:large subunit ribosomal protein L29
MKINEIRPLDDGDLQVRLEKARKELYELRVKAHTESIDNPREIRSLRRTVARILTERRQRELKGETHA